MILEELKIAPGSATDGDWFPWCESTVDQTTGKVVFEEPKESGIMFCIRSTTPFWVDKNKDRKRESSFALNPQTRAMERVTYFVPQSPEKEQEEIDDSWDYAIVAARKGEEDIPMSKEDKVVLARTPKFQRWIKRVFDALSGDLSAQQETESKNLPTG